MFTIFEMMQFVMEQQQTDAVTALRKVLGRGDTPVVYRAGRFVYVQVYDHGSMVLAEQAVANQPGIEEVKGFVVIEPDNSQLDKNAICGD